MPWIEANGTSFHYKLDGAGPVVILLHELGGSSESWRAVSPLLAADRRVLAVDLRAAGRSEKPPGAFSLADVADDLEALLRVLNVDRVDVIGAALGSLVGTLLALRHSNRVGRLILCAVAPDMAGSTRAYLVERAEKVRAVGMRGVADASLANSFPESRAAERAAYRGIYLGNDPAAYAELSLALARLEMTPSDWCAVRAPTSIVSGAHDFLWPPPVGRQVAESIPGARFTAMDDAGHFLHLQAPQSLTSLAREFLDR